MFARLSRILFFFLEFHCEIFQFDLGLHQLLIYLENLTVELQKKNKIYK